MGPNLPYIVMGSKLYWGYVILRVDCTNIFIHSYFKPNYSVIQKFNTFRTKNFAWSPVVQIFALEDRKKFLKRFEFFAPARTKLTQFLSPTSFNHTSFFNLLFLFHKNTINSAYRSTHQAPIFQNPTTFPSDATKTRTQKVVDYQMLFLHVHSTCYCELGICTEIFPIVSTRIFPSSNRSVHFDWFLVEETFGQFLCGNFWVFCVEFLNWIAR